jgi:hypothetical protein
MSEWYDSQKKPSSNFRKLLQERLDKTNPRPKLTTEEIKRLTKLEAIAAKLKRGEHVQNRQLQSWLNTDEYEQIATEWDTQKHFREELKEKPDELKRYEDKLKEAIMMRNRADAYHRKGKKSAAYKLDSKCENLCEDVLEILQEIVAADTSLQIWFDRHLDCASKLQHYGRYMTATERHAQLAKQFIELSERCHKQINAHAMGW